MKNKFSESIKIPEGISCSYGSGILECYSGKSKISKRIIIHGVSINVSKEEIIFKAEKAGRKEIKYIKTNLAHIRNLFSGLSNKYSYILESCYVHFPMTLKLDGNNLIISNFLGEKTSRKAIILPGVEVELKGNRILLSSSSKDSAGQTAANIERATKIKNRDRRVFQDGIFIVEKAGAKL